MPETPGEERAGAVRIMGAFWPALVLGLIAALVAFLLEPNAKALLCVPAKTPGVSTCNLLYEYGFEKGLLKDIALFLIGVPIVTAFFANKVRSFLSEAIGKAMLENPSSIDIVHGQLQRRELRSADVSRLLVQAIRFHDGTDNELRSSLGEFFDRELTMLRESGCKALRTAFSSTLTIRESSYRPADFFAFSEILNFQVDGKKGDIYDLYVQTALRAPDDCLEEILKLWKFDIELDDFNFDLVKELENIDVAGLRTGEKLQSGPLTACYDGTEIEFVIKKSIKLSSTGLMVTQSESGVISKDERDSATCLKYPTRGVTIVVNLPDALEIDAVTFAPNQLGAAGTQKISADRTQLLMSYDDWVMAGICSVVTWKPRAAKSAVR